MSHPPLCPNGWCRGWMKFTDGKWVCVQCDIDKARLQKLPPLERYRNAEACRQR